MFENRVLPFEQKTRFHTGQKKQDDCDFWWWFNKKPIDKNFQPIELGYDQRSGNLYDNKDFQSIAYLLDDTGLINIRSKDLDLLYW
jgi:hypothetical protein